MGDREKLMECCKYYKGEKENRDSIPHGFKHGLAHSVFFFIIYQLPIFIFPKHCFLSTNNKIRCGYKCCCR